MLRFIFMFISAKTISNCLCYITLKNMGRCSPISRSDFPRVGGTPTKVPKIFEVPKKTLNIWIKDLCLYHRWTMFWSLFWAQFAPYQVENGFFMNFFPLIGWYSPNSPYLYILMLIHVTVVHCLVLFNIFYPFLSWWF